MKVVGSEVFRAARATCAFMIPIILTILFGIVIFDLGFQSFYTEHPVLSQITTSGLKSLSILFLIRFLAEVAIRLPIRTRISNFLLIVLVLYLVTNAEAISGLNPMRDSDFTAKKILLYSGISVLFVVETFHILRFIYRKGSNPAFLFVGSFVTLIVSGGLMLLLPRATEVRIQPLDAFFTSVSAVCVTGLTVVDTATTFTTFGKIVILLLIQVGGFGIMTFAGVISYWVTGAVSFQNQLALRAMISDNDRLSNVISFVSQIVVVTICFEGIGALFIYASLVDVSFPNEWERIFFSVFHAVSAFCNAGFSTFSNNLYENPVRFNYNLHWILAILIILGGTGFPVVFSIFNYFKIKIKNLVRRILGNQEREAFSNILPASSRLALNTTAILLLAGFTAYFVFEYNATLKPHETLWGKVTTSFFGSVTPRTAGFNTVELRQMTLPTVMVYLLLMWIGASPGSTGGGIKTTVAATAFLNMKSIVTGRKRTEVHRSEISAASIHRAFAIVILSLTILGLAVLLLSIYDSKLGLLELAFETFSAFSTVGLTLGITTKLSWFGKLVIMVVMFIGRVGALTLLFAIVTKSAPTHYRYPTEEIMF